MLRRLNHAVLYVRDAKASAEFYRRMLGFEIVNSSDLGMFLKAPGAPDSHNLALFALGPDAAASRAGRGSVGMYHLAWEVDTLAELVDIRDRLEEAGALVGASDHGLTKSLYAFDLDQLEFEVLWEVPLDSLDEQPALDTIRPLDLEAEVARYGPDLSRN